MVKADVRDQAQVRMDDIGAIQSASQSDLHNCYIYLLFCKIMKGHGSGQFEERRVKRFEETPVLFDEINYKLLGNRRSVDSDPFTEVYQMWRRVESGPVTGRLKDSCQGM